MDKKEKGETMFWIGYAIYLFVISTVLALLEIQIEGASGWAEKLPCWRSKEGSRVSKIYAKLLGPNKPLTGYHLAVNSLVILVLHAPFFAKTTWSLVGELEVISSYFLILVVWDFLWFVWNPHYGLKRFNSQNKDIWWMRDWIGGVIPKDYPKGLWVSGVFAAGTIFFGGPGTFIRWGVVVGVMGGLTLASCVFSQLLRIGQD